LRASVFLVDKSTAASRGDFACSWDADWHPPELYRALRAWAQRDVVDQFAMSPGFSAMMKQMLQGLTTYTRKKVAALVDHTVIYNRDGTTTRFSATAASV